MTTEMKPHFEHDCEECKYVGTVACDSEFFDFYRCTAHGSGMTIMRGADGAGEVVSLPDAAVVAALERAVAAAVKGEEEAGLLILICGVAIMNGLQGYGVPE